MSSEEEDTNFGRPVKQTKKNPAGSAKPKPQRVMERKEDDKPKVVAPKAEKPKAVKDIVVTAGDDVVEVEKNKQPASIVFIGHVDAGKSTISG